MREDNVKDVWGGGWDVGLRERYEEELFWEELEEKEQMGEPTMGMEDLIQKNRRVKEE